VRHLQALFLKDGEVVLRSVEAWGKISGKHNR
jgi:hypothetical protein